jgi:glycine betaine/proline transport system ATP-binding protein
MEGGRIVQAGPPETIVTAPSTDYVRDFVANVNPLRVLTAGSIVRSVAGRLPLSLPTAHGLLEIRADGTAEVGGSALEVEPLVDGVGAAPGPGLRVWSCHAATPVQALVQAAAEGEACFLVTDDAGEVSGVIGERELFAALLR